MAWENRCNIRFANFDIAKDDVIEYIVKKNGTEVINETCTIEYDVDTDINKQIAIIRADYVEELLPTDIIED